MYVAASTSSEMIANFNIGLMGHVDSGKTTLARALSSIAGTAAFDKNPQSQERGITLDLGFSALLVEPPPDVKLLQPALEQMQLTFVDCPGHASLIRTIIGGAQIIDLMILVIDAQKGIQTQTAECIIIGELLKLKVIVVVNKIDLLDGSKRDAQLSKLNAKLRNTLERTKFGGDIPIFNVSALEGTLMEELDAGLRKQLYLPDRNKSEPFMMYVDHCFAIKGQGTVCTGTIVQGQVRVNDTVELPAIHEQRKVKSLQMFHRPVQIAKMGDRLGLCVTQFNAKLLERGVLAQPGYLQPMYAACIRMERIHYHKFAIKSKSKLHVTVGHQTVMCRITLFKSDTNHEDVNAFDMEREYELLDEMEPAVEVPSTVFALLEFEAAVYAAPQAILIASKLDMDVHSSSCRLAFWGCIQWSAYNANYAVDQLPKFRIFKSKQKLGTVQRLVDDRHIIVQNLFKKINNRDQYIGKWVELSTGERGLIDSTFGATSKVKIIFATGLKEQTLDILRNGHMADVQVLLNYKKFIFNKNLPISQ